MLSRSTSLCLLTVALGAAALPAPRATPNLGLSFTSKFNTKGTQKFDLARADRARIEAMAHTGHAIKSGNHKRASAYSVDATNAAVVYTTTITIGSEGEQYSVLVDTGSSNTWAGSAKPYTRTSTTNCSSGIFTEVDYGSGLFFGEVCTDTVALSPQMAVHNMSVGYGLVTEGFDEVDGLLGIGPKILTWGTVDGMTDYIPTIIDELAAQGTIPSDMFSIYFQPTTTMSLKNGELTIGGVDSAKCESAVTYVPLTTTTPAAYYWGIDAALTYNNSAVLEKTAGIVDTGTTLTYIASNAFAKYQNATGATLDSTTGLLSITPDRYENLLGLDIVIGGQNFKLTPNAQVWPRALNAEIGGSDDSLYLIVNDIGTLVGSGLDFILGYTFLERYYSVFDETNQRMGFASTTQTNAVVN
ncbi:aspartic peptidase A1 [Punctularia strigosozonata HHB-11173 SS5]|uniref:Aspartic peptidase A1 n=1 Tax=Punctularia strigosozonata (strain HHB-11173) TaxID=741275 RepID=R7S3J2_PUNST|nr:aspartic peptidase A1 [Punctularia strigosozonata HHB-11173 SS5]EIN03786.1 aspartic peptidase A1 [Punctularia strigosozonata HHB-11173 SS5]